MGFARVAFNTLALGENCAWAVPATFTSPEDDSMHCYEDGTNCLASEASVTESKTSNLRLQ